MADYEDDEFAKKFRDAPGEGASRVFPRQPTDEEAGGNPNPTDTQQGQDEETYPPAEPPQLALGTSSQNGQMQQPSPNGQLQILGPDGRPIRPMTPQEQFTQQQNVFLRQLPSAMRNEYMLSQMKLTQQEQMRLSKMQNAIGAIKARDDLSDPDKLDLITQLQTGINPLVQRQAKAKLLETSLRNQAEQAELKRRADNTLFVQKHQAENIDKRIAVSHDPRTGQERHLFVDKDGNIKEVPDEGNAKTQEIQMRQMEHKERMTELQAKNDQAREDRLQKVVDTGVQGWHKVHDKVAKEVDAHIEEVQKNESLDNDAAKKAGTGVRQASTFNRDAMIAEKMKANNYSPTLEDEVARLRRAHGSPQVGPASKQNVGGTDALPDTNPQIDRQPGDATPSPVSKPAGFQAAKAPLPASLMLPQKEHPPFDASNSDTMNSEQQKTVSDLKAAQAAIMMIAASAPKRSGSGYQPGASENYQEMAQQIDSKLLPLLAKYGSPGNMPRAERAAYLDAVKQVAFTIKPAK